MDVLKCGSFSIKRTTKPYSRSDIDLTLEQTVNRDAASTSRGIGSFQNSPEAIRRWTLSLNQRSACVFELRDMTQLEQKEQVSTQNRKS